MMRKKIAIIMTTILVGLLAIGGTMAWFTAESKEVTNTFKAGTVDIKLVDIFNGRRAQNVNPGDCYYKKVYVKNTGTKNAYIRVKLNAEFNPELPVEGVVTYLVDGWETDWVKIGDWYYYKHIVTTRDKTNYLIDGVRFEGKKMDNEYQGATFTITVKAEAIQASHDAIKEEWGIDPEKWEPIVAES
jgi:predicted ribosomally synthesized peptide with SipW-like signal peptide